MQFKPKQNYPPHLILNLQNSTKSSKDSFILGYFCYSFSSDILYSNTSQQCQFPGK